MCYVFVRNDDIKYIVYIISVWWYVSMVYDIVDFVDGFYVFLLVKFFNIEVLMKWVFYQEKYVGVFLNFIILIFVILVYVIGLIVDYKFYIVFNLGYFEFFNLFFNDDFRFVVVREYKDLSWIVVDLIFGNFGMMSLDILI